MLQRLLFVAGMTVGVMVPLIWAAYVSVPEFHAAHERAGDWGQRDAIGIDLREARKPKGETTAAADSSQPKSDIKSVTISASPSLKSEEPEKLTKPILPQAYDRKPNQTPASSEKVKPTLTEDVLKSVTTSVSPSLESEPEQLTKLVLPQAFDRKANEAPALSEKVKPTPAEDVLKSVATSASPSLEPEPEQLTKPVLPQASDRKVNQAPPSSKKVKPTAVEDVISTGSIAAHKKTLQRKHPVVAHNARHNKKPRASSKRASSHKIVDRAPLSEVPDVNDSYVYDRCRQRVKFYDDWGGWISGHRLDCW